jgi:hypothetical protein
MAKTNRFAALRELQDLRQEEQDIENPAREESADETGDGVGQGEAPEQPEALVPSKDSVPKQQRPKAQTTTAKRGPGRPRGRRSNPDYTQISAYIPLELLLEVQDELAEERREQRQRTPRPVSDLMEELLADWLKKRKRKKSGT